MCSKNCICDGGRTYILLVQIQLQSCKIIHIGNFGERTDHRLYNLSIAHKLTNGLVRNGHDVINCDYRNFNKKLVNFKSLDEKIIDIIENYRPNLILLGHNNNLFRETLQTIKIKYQCKIALWYEDHLIKGDPNYSNGLNEKDKYFWEWLKEIYDKKYNFD